MDPKKLVTLTFAKNVGSADRIFRLLSGAALASVGWYLALPVAAACALSLLGMMWLATGVTSKCSIYYVLGYSTCPVSGGGSQPGLR
jgi:hypothetical protein